MSPSKTEPGETIVDPIRSGPAKVPALSDYYEVVPMYREDAEEALAKERVPRRYEFEVRRYYEALDKGPSKTSDGGSDDAASTDQ